LAAALGGRVAIVTGAAGGIGSALCRQLAAAGARVGLLSRTAGKLEPLVDELRRGGATVGARAVDVGDRTALAAAIHALESELGPIELLVHNAGVGKPTTPEAPDLDDLEEMLRVNYLGGMYAVEAVLPGMLARGRGRIVAVSSLGARRGLAWSAGYSASKAALATYLESLRPPLRRRGITVTTVFLGFVRTDMTAALPLGLRFAMMSPEAAARGILDAAVVGRPEASLPRHQAAFTAVLRRLPAWAMDWFMDAVGRYALRQDRRRATALASSSPALPPVRCVDCGTMLGPVITPAGRTVSQAPSASEGTKRPRAGAGDLSGSGSWVGPGSVGPLAGARGLCARLSRPGDDFTALLCTSCGRVYPHEDGLLVAQGELRGNNRIAADFYNSDRWQRFRPFENLFLKAFGGIPGARRQVLRHLRPLRGGSLLEVGIGDGENVALLPPTWQVSGVDIARVPLAACRDRHVGRGLFLALAEGEHLPFADHSFDAVLCVGGFNFFRDPPGALAEMARVTRPGGRVVVADELPDLFRWGWGHLLGWPAFDAWLMERFWLGPEFTSMVLNNRLDIHRLARMAPGTYRVHPIWRGFGYCIAGSPGVAKGARS
jgi:short-subunit dehydrogenase/SAM-dependent methyltransferase